jgi:hypothetical protein
MWTLSIVSVKKLNKTGILVSVLFENTNKELSFTEDYTLTSPTQDLEYLKRIIRAQIEALDAVYALAESIPVGPLTLENVGISDEEIEKQLFQEDIITLVKMQNAIKAGLKKESDEDYIALTLKVKENYKDEYVSIIPQV